MDSEELQIVPASRRKYSRVRQVRQVRSPKARPSEVKIESASMPLSERQSFRLLRNSEKLALEFLSQFSSEDLVADQDDLKELLKDFLYKESAKIYKVLKEIAEESEEGSGSEEEHF